jgi:hypothetical protein
MLSNLPIPPESPVASAPLLSSHLAAPSDPQMRDVQQALRHLNQPTRLAGNPWLASRVLTRQLQNAPDHLPQEALRAVFDQVLGRLSSVSLDYAAILRGRYWDGRPAKEMIRRGRYWETANDHKPPPWPESTFYDHHHKAIRAFAQILDDMERACRSTMDPLDAALVHPIAAVHAGPRGAAVADPSTAEQAPPAPPAPVARRAAPIARLISVGLIFGITTAAVGILLSVNQRAGAPAPIASTADSLSMRPVRAMSYAPSPMPAALDTHTPAPLATATAVPTQPPTAAPPTPITPPIELLPVAIGADAPGLVRLGWQLPVEHGKGAMFDVRVCFGPGCQPERGRTNTSDSTWIWCPDQGPGIYRWQVVGIDIDGASQQPRGPSSAVGEFAWPGGACQEDDLGSAGESDDASERSGSTEPEGDGDEGNQNPGGGVPSPPMDE